MNLTIDAGNTSVKMVLFDRDRITKVHTFKKLSVADLRTIFSKHSIQYSILSAVIDTDKMIHRFLRANSFFIQLDSTTRLPVKNKYKTPSTLGSDRLASAVGATKIFPGKNVLIIDAGTCIKYDFINAKHEYLGGSISPGLCMRFEALHNFTSRLPLIHPGNAGNLVGSTTKDAIRTGVQEGIIHEINGFIEQYKKRFRMLKVVLSGGDAPMFAGRLKSSIFAAPNLIHVGLHEILKYNVEQE